jgi:hypothetical protein|tara:strand:+ start:132 stop:407 length:276 start_codon:yes stop_codon:yes gene_type:complete
MAQTVTECLAAGTDSVTLIDQVKAGTHDVTGMTQAEINEMVQRNVDHLSTILLYAPVDGDDDTPDIAGAAGSKKTTHVAAVTTGNAYIAAN